MCDDYVWDPTLEELRLRKIGAGTFTRKILQIFMSPNFGFRAKGMATLLSRKLLVRSQLTYLSYLSVRKRKRDELSPEAAKEEARYIALNTNQVPCKATGLRGIYNAGATCYQNVILQSFLHNPFLRNYYLSDGHQSGECQTQYCMSCAMDDIFQDFYSQETTNGYTAANMLCGFWSLERKAFANLVTTKEQDAHEFFQLLAEELHERNGDGKRPESGSEHLCDCIIHQTYYGKLQSNTTCQGCGSVTNQVQSFLDLSLGLDSTQKKKKLAGTKSEGGSKGASLSLQDCLEEEYVKSDKCEYRCNKCSSTQQARRNTSLKRLPNVLSIQLKVNHVLDILLMVIKHLVSSPCSKFFAHISSFNFHSVSSTSKGAMTRRSRLIRLSSFRYSSTCSPIRIGVPAPSPRKTTNWRGHANMISSVSWNT